MKKILIAVDGSDASMRAVATGSEIAEKFGARLYLLHVLRDTELPKNLRQFAIAEHLSGGPKAVMHEAAQYILSGAEDLAREKGVAEVETEVLSGPPARTIVRFSKDQNADLIVMGRRGLGAGTSSKIDEIGEILVGGVSRRVGILAHCGCLTVI